MGAMCRMIQSERILVDISAKSKEDCLRRLVEAMLISGQVSDGEQLLRDILQRESMSTTGLGCGCAVPHAHSEAVSQTLVAAARLTSALDFSSDDGEPVSLVFLMVGPPKNTGLHLKVLSKLARYMHDPDMRASLMGASDAEEFYTCICGEDQ